MRIRVRHGVSRPFGQGDLNDASTPASGIVQLNSRASVHQQPRTIEVVVMSAASCTRYIGKQYCTKWQGEKA